MPASSVCIIESSNPSDPGLLAYVDELRTIALAMGASTRFEIRDTNDVGSYSKTQTHEADSLARDVLNRAMRA